MKRMTKGHWLGLLAVLMLAAGLTASAAETAPVAPQGSAGGGAAEAPPAKTPVTVDMSKGGVTFASGDNSITLGAWIQVDWVGNDWENYDADTSGSGVGKEDGFSSQFRINRLRLYLMGTMWRPWVKYKFEFEFSNTTGEGDNKIKDGYVEFDYNHWATPRAGQFKVPFCLQELTSDRYQAFIERSIADAKFAPGRDLGIQLAGLSKSAKWGYAVGVFNGGGESRLQDDQSMLYAGRIWWDPLGEYKLSSGAIDNTGATIIHLGVDARTGEVTRGTATAGVFEDPNNETAYETEFALRWKRLWASAEYYWETDELQNPVQGPDVDSRGFYVEVTGLVVPKKFELGFRYSQVDPDTDIDNDLVKEIRGLAALYLRGHNLKFQLDFGQILTQEAFPGLPPIALRALPPLGVRIGPPQDYADTQIRAQLQLAF